MSIAIYNDYKSGMLIFNAYFVLIVLIFYFLFYFWQLIRFRASFFSINLVSKYKSKKEKKKKFDSKQKSLEEGKNNLEAKDSRSEKDPNVFIPAERSISTSILDTQHKLQPLNDSKNQTVSYVSTTTKDEIETEIIKTKKKISFKIKGRNIQFFIVKFIPYFIIMCLCVVFFVYLFYVNEPFNIYDSLNFSLREPFLVLLPTVMAIYLFYLFVKELNIKISNSIEDIFFSFCLSRYDSKDSRFKIKINAYIKYFFLIMLVSFLSIRLIGLSVLTAYICMALILLVYTIIFYPNSEFFVFFKQKLLLEKQRKSVKKKETLKKNIDYKLFKEKFSIIDLILLALFVFCLISYFVNFLEMQDRINSVYVFVKNDYFLSGLVIYNLVMFVLIRGSIIITRVILALTRKIYKKAIVKKFRFLFKWLIILSFFEAILFNLRSLNLGNPIVELIVSASLGFLISYISNKLRLYKSRFS